MAGIRTKKRKLHRFTLGDCVIYGIMIFICILFIAPFIYVVSISLTDPDVYVPFKLYLFPEKASLKTYSYILSNPSFLSSLKNTVYITVVGTVLDLSVTYTFAYVLTKRKMPFHKVFMGMVVFTLMFNAGIIPNFLMVKSLGLINNRWALILPVLTNAWSLIVAKSFIESIPFEIEESAKIDGCNDIDIFFKMIIPLSKASIATLTLFFAVGHWNTYFNALIYLTDSTKRTLQVYVKSLLIDASTTGVGVDVMNMPSETVRMATVILAMLPILIVYPFLQKYFVKGVMVGSVKG
jgi:putative aldouronate transport system permease protein